MATKTATNYLEERLGANPDSLAFSRLADYYLKKGEIDRAIETCSRGVNLHPHNTTGRLVLGRCYMEKKRWEEAVGVFRDVCRLDPRNLVAMKLLGDLLLKQGSSAPAHDLYRLIVRIDPFDAMMANVASRSIGSGKTELSDILGQGMESAKNSATPDAASAGDSGKESMEPASDVLETVEATTDGSDDAAVEETFDTVEIAESDAPVLESIQEIDTTSEFESLTQESLESPSPMHITEGEASAIVADEIEGVVDAGNANTGDDLMEFLKESGATDLARLSAGTSPEIPDGQAISSRLDSLFGDETTPRKVVVATPASLFVDTPTEQTHLVPDMEAAADSIIQDAAPESLVVDDGDTAQVSEASAVKSTSGEHEELFIDSRQDLVVEEGASGDRQVLIGDAEGEDSRIDSGSGADEPPARAARQDDSVPGHSDATLDRLDIVTPTLAEIYFKQGQLQRALTIYKRLLEKDPGSDYLKQCIATVNTAIASGGEGIPMVEEERGKASRKIIEDSAAIADSVELHAPGTVPESKPKEKKKLK